MAQPVRHVLVGHAHKVAKCCQVDIVGLQGEKKSLNPKLRSIPNTLKRRLFNVLSSNVTVCVDVVLKITLNLRYCNISESKTNHQLTQNTKSPAI